MLRVEKTSCLVGALLFVLTACNSGASRQGSVALLADNELAKVHAWVNPPADANRANTRGEEQLDSVSTLLTGLEFRLQSEPYDLKGWSLLAQSYAFVGRMEDAYTAVDRAVELGADRGPLERRVRAAHGEGG
jgi:cytochrome c-type biogenesis protein CcmH/NrfG